MLRELKWQTRPVEWDLAGYSMLEERSAEQLWDKMILALHPTVITIKLLLKFPKHQDLTRDQISISKKDVMLRFPVMALTIQFLLQYFPMVATMICNRIITPLISMVIQVNSF